MRKSIIYSVSCFFLIFSLVGCCVAHKKKEVVPDRDILNEFILEDVEFDWTPLINVLNYVESEINRQSCERWEIMTYQAEGDLRSLSVDQATNSLHYKGTFREKIGVGDFFLFLTESTNTQYKIENNVIYFSRRVNIHIAEPPRDQTKRADPSLDYENDPFAPSE